MINSEFYEKDEFFELKFTPSYIKNGKKKYDKEI